MDPELRATFAETSLLIRDELGEVAHIRLQASTVRVLSRTARSRRLLCRGSESSVNLHPPRLQSVERLDPSSMMGDLEKICLIVDLEGFHIAARKGKPKSFVV